MNKRKINLMLSYKIKVILTKALNGSLEDEKTSIIEKIANYKFSSHYKNTFGVSILTKEVEIDNGGVAIISIWDIGKYEKFKKIRHIFYKGAVGAILLFDLSKGQTFEELKRWHSEIRRIAKEEIQFLIIGIKFDFFNDDNENIVEKKARLFAEKEGCDYVEILSQREDLIVDILTEFAKKIVKSYEKL